MFFSGVGHRFFLFKDVLISRTVEIATVGTASSGDEDFSCGQSASRCIILYFAIVDGCKTVDVVYWTQSQYLFSLAEETDFWSHFMADLNEALISCEGHDKDWKFYDGGFFMFFGIGLI